MHNPWRKAGIAAGVAALIMAVSAVSGADAPTPGPEMVSTEPAGAASTKPAETFWITGEVTPAGVCRCECPVTATPIKADTLSKEESRTLLGEFVKAQKSVLLALQHRHRLEIMEMKNTQNARRREQSRKEQENRRDFVRTKPGAPEKKLYEEDLKKRWELFDQILREESEQKKSQQKYELDGVKGDQAKKLVAFKEYLSKGERPPMELWPRRGY